MNLVVENTKRKNGRNHGVVFTNLTVVNYILDEVNYFSTRNLKNVRILEPASGNGSFAIEIIKRLYQSSLIFCFNFNEALENNVRFVELETNSCKNLVFKINLFLKSNKIDGTIDFNKIVINTDFLTHYFYESFDCIVGNPPYIRHEKISEEAKRYFRKRFKTFKFRADIYILFYEKSLNLLTKNGLLSFICSNRWLYNQYGQLLRNEISKKFNLKKVLNIENASPFDESVIAYPCITTIENRLSTGKVLYYESSSNAINLSSITLREINSPKNSSWENIFLEYDINHTSLSGILEQEFEIGIGVATGADKIYIIGESQREEIEQNRLIPIVTTKDITSDRIIWRKKYLVNPYENDVLCDLNDYPKLKKYFESNKEVLLKRHTAKNNKDKWYKTIDKIKPELTKKPKLLLPDIAGIKKLIIDDGNYYPHHNLYYITGKSIHSLKILASILMSDFIREQLSQIGIRMNGGFPRFQSQVLKKLRIPNIELIEPNDKLLLISSYDVLDLRTINQIINKYCTQQGV